MWDVVKGFFNSATKAIFGQRNKRKREESDDNLSYERYESSPAKRSRFDSSLNNGKENKYVEQSHDRFGESSQRMGTRKIVSNPIPIVDISDDDSDEEPLENQQLAYRIKKKNEKAFNSEVSNRYSKFWHHHTPIRRTELSSHGAGRYVRSNDSLRGVLFRSPTSTSALQKPRIDFHLETSFGTTLSYLKNDFPCSTSPEAFGNEKSISHRSVEPRLDFHKASIGYLSRDILDEAGPSGGTPSVDGSTQDDVKSPNLLDSQKVSIASTWAANRIVENQGPASSESVSVAETVSSDNSLSPIESRSPILRRYASIELLDELCTRSPLTDLNEKFKMHDPTHLRMDLSRINDAKASRDATILKLNIEAQMRRDARLANQKSIEEVVRVRMRLEGLLIEEKEVEEDLEFLELTDEQLAVVNRAIGPGRSNEVLTEDFNLQVTRHDLQTLSGLNWLNDEVINFFFSMLMARGGKEGFLKVYSQPTFFYSKLMQSGHDSLKRWTRKVDIFAHDLMLIPVHLGVHWCLMVVDFRKTTIFYFDSLGGSNSEGMNAVLKYLQAESMDKKKAKLDTSNWSLQQMTDIPYQSNGSDCGMFTCRFAEYLSRDAPITFNQEHMPYFRRRTIYEILSKRLL